MPEIVKQGSAEGSACCAILALVSATSETISEDGSVCFKGSFSGMLVRAGREGVAVKQ
ncbi:hypothetical protein CP061683_0482 [Chlamydia psittaci 06-1683]|nr:hypothetical protein CP061683_0482 [Chlamydia psittaci 06-1683]